MLLRLSHRFNLEHTLLKRKPKGEKLLYLYNFVSNGTLAYFKSPSGWKIILFYITWVVQQGTFSSMFAPSLNIIHFKKPCSFLQLFNHGNHSLLLASFLCHASSASLSFHPLSSAQEAGFSTIQPQLHCISHSFQHARI